MIAMQWMTDGKMAGEREKEERRSVAPVSCTADNEDEDGSSDGDGGEEK